ncbi:WecB/TagA/CpsF family glycosyltransferase [Patescibacteria group bacterium]
MPRIRTTILGTKIDVIDFDQALKQVEIFLQRGRHHVVTPNPEFVLQARKDKKFREIVNSADLAIPDGFGLVIASQFTKNKIKQTVTGSNLVPKILNICSANNLSVAIVNLQGSLATAPEIQLSVQAKYPQLNLKSYDIAREDVFAVEILEKLWQFKPDVIFATFGSPLQDTWLAGVIDKLPDVRLAMGVGGTFDFIAGKRDRAPKIFRKLGLEWLHRMFAKPRGGQYHFNKRLSKIFRSLIIFPIIFIFTFNKS